MTFEKHFHSYDDNAFVQKEVAKALKALLEKLPHKVDSILEIGCGTGIFTKELKSSFPQAKLCLNDKYDTRSFFHSSDYSDFLIQDAEKAEFASYDLISSSGCFQWFQNPKNFLEKISKKSDQLLFSIFLEDNLKEIKEHFSISLDYPDVSELLSLLRSEYEHCSYEEQIFVLDFPNPMAALRHLQATGVTGIGKTNIHAIKNYPYKTLTYRVGYFLCYR